MKPGILLSVALACCAAATPALALAAPPTASAAATLTAPEPSPPPSPPPPEAAPAPLDGAVAPPARPDAAPAVAAAPSPSSAPSPSLAPSALGSMLQTTLALLFVLALLAGLAWLLKRYGPRAAGGNANVRLVGSLGLGGRERILVVEVADQWIVVGAAPGRVNALATLPRQEGAPSSPLAGAAAPTAHFADWLKQTIERRNGK